MNTLITLNNENLTMSSREIAELVEARHDSVKRTIERLQDKGLIQLTPLVEVKNHLGQTVTEYRLVKRDTYIVVAQLCPEFTARLVDRWQELENQIRQPLDPMQMLNDPRTLRGLLDNYTEKVLVLEHKVEEMKPTVAAFDRIATKAEGSMCITDSAKHLGIKPKFLFDFLSSQKWIYKRAGNSNWIAYQDKLQQLLLEHKIHVAMRDDGTEKVCERVLITAKGLAKLAKIFELQQAA
ncbi:TPA: phage antirepressor KilAC domain-containing protein [Pasteurella multocida]|nr:phage antirepressor KilAC domain-containing protein [Pasteurella multocida]HEH9677165.1 phage antirepressor KilAC domain-containing protein [Pasteurella multocida]HEH9690498.1 phage antirepressor KilAC domain-containing protein [Pasteurella multocida]HEH9732941.1 phage antirepressor KilAC domain-containing protein [Pasteurella multocida]HEH9783036.1 phage antirepressor KilAC domain-containing protein [Pasteurella multocida]